MTVHEEENVRRGAVDVFSEEVVVVDEESQVYHSFMALISRRMIDSLSIVHDVGIELNPWQIRMYPVEIQSFFLGRSCDQCHARWIGACVVDSMVYRCGGQIQRGVAEQRVLERAKPIVVAMIKRHVFLRRLSCRGCCELLQTSRDEYNAEDHGQEEATERREHPAGSDDRVGIQMIVMSGLA